MWESEKCTGVATYLGQHIAPVVVGFVETGPSSYSFDENHVVNPSGQRLALKVSLARAKSAGRQSKSIGLEFCRISTPGVLEEPVKVKCVEHEAGFVQSVVNGMKLVELMVTI